MRGVPAARFTPVAERVLTEDLRRPWRAAVVRPAGHGADRAARAAARAFVPVRFLFCFACAAWSRIHQWIKHQYRGAFPVLLRVRGLEAMPMADAAAPRLTGGDDGV